MGKGIDYGRGLTNVDRDTGIRYGVIPAHDVGQAWDDSSEPDYGEPCCPNCGSEVTEDFPRELEDDEGRDYYCADCDVGLSSDVCYGDTPDAHTFSDDGYEAMQGGDDSDIFITKSPFYTRAAYCSPCAPGACHLRNPCDDGDRAYCFGHDWFEDGKAPYPVYSVATGELVSP